MKFKAVRNLPHEIQKYIDVLSCSVYQLFYEDRSIHSFKSLKIDQDWLMQQPWYKKGIDYNAVNKQIGYPPYYIIIKRTDKIEDFLKKEFPNITNIDAIGSEVDFEVKDYELPDYKKK